MEEKAGRGVDSDRRWRLEPRALRDLSQALVGILEKGLEEARESGSRVPVFLCHPLDPLESPGRLEAGLVGILYPARLSPDTRARQGGWTIEPRDETRRGDRLRMPGLWLRVRYFFLVAGGTLEEELEALAVALRILHDHPLLPAPPEAEPGAPPGGFREKGQGDEVGESDAALPLVIVEDPDGWRELGLPEHRMTVAFEVTVPLQSTRTRNVERIHERDLRIDEGNS